MLSKRAFSLAVYLLFSGLAIHALSQETLHTGRTYPKKLLKNESHTYVVTLDKGAYAELVVMQKGVDLAIDVNDPSGYKLQTFDSPNGANGPEPVSWVAGSKGNYQIRVYPLNESATGDYEINDITILTAEAYQQKLAKEKQDSAFIAGWMNNNAGTIVKPDISIAGKIFDLQFTSQEIDSMLGGVKEENRIVKETHTYHLDNSVPLTLWQSPVVPGMTFNDKQQPIEWNIASNEQLPKNKNDLAFYSILQLASLIKNKKITSVELTQFFIDRLKKFGDTLKCVISLTEDIAVQQAKQADAEIAAGKYRGPLHGIPYGLKDLFAVKGTKTTWGAAPYKDQVIDEDSYVYTKLKEAGAVLVAKFSMGALALGDQWYGGRTNNPWNLNKGSSGSSAGSTAATVAGLVPFAIGTETLGSIVSPSSTCGATGLRPTFGSVSRTGAMTLSWSMDKTGPICRSAEDAAIVFSYIHGTDGKDMCAVDHAFNYMNTVDVKQLKIGYAENYFKDLDSTASEWKVLDEFRRLGATIVPVDFVDSNAFKLSVWNIVGLVLNAESAAAFDEFTRSNLDDQMTAQTKNDWPNTFRQSRFVSAVDYINANRHRYLLMQATNTIMSQFDVIICPTFSNQMGITNLTGHPALCMPTGFNKDDLPTSITLIGNLYDEATLLEVGNLYQQATGWNKMHPEMFK